MTAFLTAQRTVLDLADDLPSALPAEVKRGAEKAADTVPPGFEHQQGALATIARIVPGEGIAVYVGIYSAATLLWRSPDGPNPWIAMSCVLVAVGINIFAIVWGARAPLRRLSGEKRKLAKRRLVLQGFLLSLLCMIYISATVGNPFELLLGFPPIGGLVLAVVAAAIITITDGSNSKGAKGALPRPQ